MSAGYGLAEELTELMVLYYDGAATEEHFVRLQHLVETCEDARQFLVLNQADCVHLRLAAEIYDIQEPPPKPPVTPLPLLRWDPLSDDRSNSHDVHPLLAWLWTHPAMAAGLSIVLLITLSLCFSPRPQVHPKSIPAGTTLAGEITGVANCRWAAGCEPSTSGDQVFIGQQFKLDGGLLEITYASGAKVILEGPVTYQVNSVNSGYLPMGKLTGKITTSNAKGFTVRTPTATVIDVGTEFGLEVAKTGETTSHVFRGAVNLVTMSATGESTGFILSQNASARVERSEDHRGDPIVVPCGSAKPERFVRVEQFLPFVRWQSQSRNIRRDRATIAYYDFQQRNGSPILLPNVGPDGGSSLDGTVKNAVWCDGPTLGRRALAFSDPSDYVWLNIAKPSQSLSLAAWVYVESLDNDFSALLMSESDRRPGQVYWGILRDGSMALEIQGLQAVGQARIQSAPLIDPGSLQRWTHLAVTYDRRSRRVCFYRDGQLVGNVAVTASRDIPIQIGPATIGRWRDDKTIPDGGPRNFRGRISELAIVGNTLSPEEVNHMFTTGSP